MVIERVGSKGGPVPRTWWNFFAIAAISLLYFFASWTSTFGFGRWFFPSTIAVGVVSVASAGYFLAHRAAFVRQVEPSDVFFGLCLVWTIVASVLLPNSKTIGYVMAYVFTFAGMAVFVRMIVVRHADRLNWFYRANEYGVMLVIAFCFVEFLGRYAFGFSVQEMMPRGAAATAVYFNFPRVYGFSEEPTYLSWYLNTLGLLSVYTRWTVTGRSVVTNCLYTACLVVTLLITFSAAGFAFILLGFGISMLVMVSTRRLLVFKIPRLGKGLLGGLATAALVVLICFGLTRDYRPLVPVPVSAATRIPLMDQSAAAVAGYSSLLEGMQEKLTLTESHGTPRLDRWLDHLTAVGQRPWFGWGPGYFSSTGNYSSLNLYIFVAAEQGLPALAFLVIAYGLVGWRIVRSSAPGQPIFLAGYVAGIVHLMTMTQHFHPALWLFIAAFYASDQVWRSAQPAEAPVARSTVAARADDVQARPVPGASAAERHTASARARVGS